MARAEVPSANSRSPTGRLSSEERKAFTIKQGVTIWISREVISEAPRSVSIPRLVTRYPTTIMMSMTITLLTTVSIASTGNPFLP